MLTTIKPTSLRVAGQLGSRRKRVHNGHTTPLFQRADPTACRKQDGDCMLVNKKVVVKSSLRQRVLQVLDANTVAGMKSDE